jgi:(S)-2-hydroxy-acid oxidase
LKNSSHFLFITSSNKQSVIKASGDGPRFFQLYITKNRELSSYLVKKAEENGFQAIVITCDAPTMGKREADERGKFHLPPPLQLEVLKSLYHNEGARNNTSIDDQMYMTRVFINQVDPSITWEDIRWLKSTTKLPIVVKGIMCAEDAKLAIDAGVSALWVSNHGGRQLDTVPAAIDVLPEVVQGRKVFIIIWIKKKLNNFFFFSIKKKI